MDLALAIRPHPIARRLPLSFEPAALVQDLARIEEDWWSKHLGLYHDGNWESVALWSPGGDIREQRSHGAPFAATIALNRCPYFASVIEAFKARRSRIRLLRLKTGGHINRHYDPMDSLSCDLLRLHVPVATHNDVDFVVNGQRVPMAAGDTWHVDVRFPHEVHNRSPADRVHLVLDLLRNPALDALLRDASTLARGWLMGYCLKQALPWRVRRFLRVEN